MDEIIMDNLSLTLLTLTVVSLSVLLINIWYTVYLFLKARELAKQEQSVYKDAQRIQEKAQEQAEQLVKQTQEKACELLTHATSVSYDIQAKLEQAMTSAVEKSRKELLLTSSSCRQAYVSAFQMLVKEAEGVLQKQCDELVNMTKTIQEKHLQEAYEQIQAEVKQYKATHISQIDSHIKETIARVTKEVLGKALSVNDQEALIFAALEKAQKEGML